MGGRKWEANGVQGHKKQNKSRDGGIRDDVRWKVPERKICDAHLMHNAKLNGAHLISDYLADFYRVRVAAYCYVLLQSDLFSFIFLKCLRYA